MTPLEALGLTAFLIVCALWGRIICGFAALLRCPIKVRKLKEPTHLFDCLHRVDQDVSHDDHATSGPMSVYLEGRDE